MGRHERTARALASIRRRGIALSGLAMIVTGLIWAAVAIASTNLNLRGFSEDSIDVNTIPNNVEQNYKINGEYERIEGVSLQKVLTKLGVDSDEWTRIFIGPIQVRRDEVFSGERVPVFDFTGPNGTEMRFIRPAKGDEDAQIHRSSNRGMTLTYRAAIDVDPDEIEDPETGDEVEFTANIPNGGPSSNYAFEWTASSGESASGKKFKYTLPSSAGRVQITVTATRSGSIVAEQTIGTPVKAPPAENSGSGSGAGGFGSGLGTGSYTTPTPDYDYNFPDPGNSSPDLPATPKAPEPDETPSLEDLGTSVEGELLSATTPLPPSSGDAASPEEESPDPEEAIEKAEQINAPGALIAAGVVVGLLGLGAGREMENVRPRRIRRPGSSGLRRLSPPWK